MIFLNCKKKSSSVHYCVLGGLDNGLNRLRPFTSWFQCNNNTSRLDGAEFLALESVVSPSVNHHDYTSTRIQSVRTWEGFRVLSGPTTNLKHSLSLDIYETI